MPYLGNEPAIAYTSTTKDSFSGDGSTTAFTMSKSANVNAVRVVVENVIQDPSVAYTCSGTTLTFTSAPPSGTNNIYVVHLGPPAATVAPPTTINNATTYTADLTIADGADIITASKGTNNVRLGENAGASIASGGNNNTTIGYNAGNAITTGDKNTAVGVGALDENTTASNNTAFGYNSAYSNVTGTDITAIGYQALEDATSGQYNTALGARAAANLTSGDFNTAIGRDTLAGVVTGDRNVAIGNAALAATTSGASNTGVGDNALVANTSANNNTAVGGNALQANTTGGPNVAMGKGALASNTTGSNNTALGFEALVTQTTSTDNTGLGAYSGYSVTTGTRNTYVGKNAGYYNTTATGNTLVGHASNGNGAGQSITTGSNNTVIGGYNGNQENLDIRTSNHNVVLSTGDGTIKAYANTGGGFKFRGNVNTDVTAGEPTHEFNGNHGSSYYNVMVNSATSSGSAFPMAIRFANTFNDTTSLFLQCYDPSSVRAQIRSNGSFTSAANSYVAYSDIKLKENIVDSGSQWDDIKALQVKKYSMKEDNLDAPNMIGVIAQDLEAAGMNGLVETNSDAFPENPDATTTTKTVKYSILYMKAVKALQEAMARIETLETKVAALEAE